MNRQWNHRVAPDPSDGLGGPPTESCQPRAERLESFAALAGGATHELNNLLAMVLMSVDLLRKTCRAAAERNALSSLEEVTRRGLHVTRQLQWLACGTECQALRFQPRYLISDLQKLMISASPSSLVVIADYPPDLWLVEGDPLLVYQMLLGLLLGAREALAGCGTVTLSARNQWLEGDDSHGPGPYLAFEVATSRPPAGSEPRAGGGRPGVALAALGAAPGRKLAGLENGETLRSLGGFCESAPPPAGCLKRVYLPAIEPGTELQ